MQRQSLGFAGLAGTFNVQSTLTATNCQSSSNNGTVAGGSTFTVTNTANNTAQIQWTDPNGGTCSFNGTQTQSGRFASFEGATYTCSNGDRGTINFSNLTSGGGNFAGQVSG